MAKEVKFVELPYDVRLLVSKGWFAVVYKATQVFGVFPQKVLAEGYISAVSEPSDRSDYQIVTK